MRQATSHPVRLVCLDLGGVLVRVCSDWSEACRTAKIDLPQGLTPATLPLLIDLGRRHESGLIDEPQFEREAAALTGVTPAQVAAAAEAWLKGAYPGASDLVARLSAHPMVRSACLSNTNPRHWRMMNSPGPNDLGLGRLTWRFLSYEIGQMKPAPAIYRHVEQATGLAPESILLFDDNADNVAAAKARGWQAERVDPCGDPLRQAGEHLAAHGLHGTYLLRDHFHQ